MAKLWRTLGDSVPLNWDFGDFSILAESKRIAVALPNGVVAYFSSDSSIELSFEILTEGPSIGDLTANQAGFDPATNTLYVGKAGGAIAVFNADRVIAPPGEGDFIPIMVGIGIF